MSREMKESGIEWVGQTPMNWGVIRGKFLFENHKDVVGAKVEDFERLALTLDGVIKRSKDDNEGLQPAEFSSYQILRKNELVFKLIDLQNISTSRVGLSPYTGIVSPAYIVLKGGERIDPRYAEYYYRMMWMRTIFNQLGDAGVRSSLNAGELLEITLPLPPLLEQHRIADFLDEKCALIDDISKKIQEEIEALEEYKKSVITEAVTKGLDPNAAMKDSGIEWIGEIPINWNITRIKYCLCEIDDRSTYGTEEPLSMSQKYGIIPTSMIDVPHTMASYVGAKKCNVEDLVFNKLKAHLGVFSVSKYKGLVSPDYAVYRSYDGINPKFLEYLFRTRKYINEFKKHITGVGQGLSRLYTKDLFNIAIALPDKAHQDLITNYANSIEQNVNSLINKKQDQISTLAEYKKSLIYEYVTGKKEVPNATA